MSSTDSERGAAAREAGVVPTSGVAGALRQSVMTAAVEAMQRELQAVQGVADRLDEQFLAAVDLLVACHGRIVVTGLGKSGHIGSKIAATLSSVGRPAQFVHSTEALHGDSGALMAGDVLIGLSNSGRTAETLAFARYATSLGVPVIALVGVPDSPLAELSNVTLDASVPREADPLNLAPTASTTAALALGDALAAASMAAANFTPDDFHLRHPSGSLGEQLAHEGGR